MSDEYLSFEDGEVKIGGMLLPGILVAQRVAAGVRFDKAHHDHSSGKRKIPLGWEDADITLTMDLLCDESGDCYSKLMAVNAIFKGSDKGANPRILQVVNRHLRARGVSRVVFAGLESNEDDRTDTIRAILSFTEHLPAVVKREKQVNAAKTAVGTPAPTVKAKPAASTTIVADPDGPFLAGFNAGSN